MSRTEFDRRFPDEAACVRHLPTHRFPKGFVCPRCDHRKGWELRVKPHHWECARCGHQTSLTAGTVMHRSHLSLCTRFLAVHILSSHSNGISAEQARLGLGSYKTAWLLLHKLRRAMVDPDRSQLAGIVEVDETEVPLLRQADPIAHYGIPNVGKLLIIGAAETDEDGRPHRLLPQSVDDHGPVKRGSILEREPAASPYRGGAHNSFGIRLKTQTCIEASQYSGPPKRDRERAIARITVPRALGGVKRNARFSDGSY